MLASPDLPHPSNNPLPELSDEMLIGMVMLILKDIARLAPFLHRIDDIIQNPNHPAFHNERIEARMLEIAKRQRMQQFEALAAMVDMLIHNHEAAFRLMNFIKDTEKNEAVDRAMRNLGIEDDKP